MKRNFVFLFVLLFLPIFCYAQKQNESTILRSDNKVWLVEDGRKSIVDEKVVIVKPKSKDAFIKKSLIGTRELGFDIFEISVPEGLKVEDYVSGLKETGDYEYVDYNIYGEYAISINDPEASNQWYLNTINAYSAWNITTGSSQIKVAVLDCGVDASHYDLGYGNGTYTHVDMYNGYNYPHNTAYSLPVYNHGTMVAGVLGAKTNNSIGIAGVSGGYNSAGITILPYCVGDYNPSLNYVISAIGNAVGKGVKIINMSLGFDSNNSGLQDAINSAYNSGVTIVCATGKTGTAQVQYPACYSNTIGVGASNMSNGRLQSSNYGTGLDLVAPGEDIKSTTLNNSYTTASGTSLAAPQVSGVAALMLSVNPSLTPSIIKERIIKTCSGYTSGYNSEVGYGVLNAYAAICAALKLRIVGPNLVYSQGNYSINSFPSISGFTVSWSLIDNHYNTGYNLLIRDYPSVGNCVIARDPNYDLMEDTLTAEIKYNNTLIQTLQLGPISAYAGFKGKYSSADLTGNISSPYIFNVRTNTGTTVTSANFYGATMTYSSSGATPTGWGFQPDNGVLNFTTSSTTAPVIINVTDVCGNSYVLYAFGSSQYNINVSNDGNCITVTLNDDDDSQRNSSIDQSWTIEVRNLTTGQLMATQSSTSRSESISTLGWPKGIYVVKATIGDEVLTEKVIVK